MSRLLPYIFLGIMIVIFAAGIILLSYLLIIGALVGLVLFAIVWIKEKLFPSKFMMKRDTKIKPPRTFDHEK